VIKNEVLKLVLENWEAVFLSIFYFLKRISDSQEEIKTALNDIHTDNAVKDEKIQHIEEDIKELKGWIQRVESECVKKIKR
jgi:hypothetical protein